MKKNLLAMVGKGKSFVKTVIMNYVRFRICYLSLLLSVVLTIVFGVLYASKIIDENVLKSGGFLNSAWVMVIGVFWGLYLNLSFIKYSFLVDALKFRRIVIIAIGLVFFNLLISSLLKRFWGLESCYNYGSFSGIVSSLLWFIGFRSVANTEPGFFQRLSRLCLYLFVFEIVSCIVSLLIKHFPELKFMNILRFLPNGIIQVLIFYWKIKLFRHLYLKYEKPSASP